MAQPTSLRDVPNLQKSPLVSSSKKVEVKTGRDKQAQTQTVKIVTSLQKVIQLQSIQALNSQQYLDTTCQLEPPVKEPFSERIYNGSIVRDVLIDTHDLINEAGGFMINFARHGQVGSNEIRIHLGIRGKRKLPSGAIRPGTITTTDDYARDIFRAIRANPRLELLTAILEIDEEEDEYEQKVCPEMPNIFLQKLIQTFPTALTKFHVQMPGISPVYLPEWKFLLDEQMCLKTLICNFGVVLWTFYQTSIMRNSGTLEKIVLRRLQTYDSATGRYFPFNWKVFSHCMNMVYLKVTCGYKFGQSLTVPHPPSTVFLHENIENLPKINIFQELHLGNIWIDPCTTESLYNSRPNLKICRVCNDLEYYDGGDKDYLDRGITNTIQIISSSRCDLRAVLSVQDQESKKKRHQRQREKQLACIVLALFFVILMALAVLFVIIYFRHLRGEQPKKFHKDFSNSVIPL